MFKRSRSHTERPGERRRYLRYAAGESRGISSAGEIALVDLSPVGAGLSTRRGGGLAPGDRHLLVVDDGRGRSFETLAEVRWSAGSPEEGFRAGLAFVTVLRDDPGGAWSGVAADPVVAAGQSHVWQSELEVEQPEEARKSPTLLRLDAYRRRRSKLR